MPEGDTVWRAGQRLHEVLAGRTLTRCEFRVPALATTDLTGVGVREVVSRGKHQLFRFSNDHTLHTHFRMDGTWRIYPAGRKWSGGPEFQIRAVLATAGHCCVGYRLPVVELIPTADEEHAVGHLGPDLLGSDWDLDEAIRRINADPHRSIGEALLDQRNLAGIGTFYRAELLFIQGIHPRTPVRDVGNLRRLVQRGQQLLYANRWRVEQSTTGDLRANRRAYVFERPGQPCRRCGTPIRTEELGPVTRERRSIGVRGANDSGCDRKSVDVCAARAASRGVLLGRDRTPLSLPRRPCEPSPRTTQNPRRTSGRNHFQ